MPNHAGNIILFITNTILTPAALLSIPRYMVHRTQSSVVWHPSDGDYTSTQFVK